MKFENIAVFGISSEQQLLGILNIDKTDLLQALVIQYRIYFKNGKLIEAPNPFLKNIQHKINNIVSQIELPCYYQACVGRNNISNAKCHVNRLESINLDIAHYFPNTKAKYIEAFFKTKLNITGQALNILMQLTTYNGHLPTGAPTSPGLAFWAHHEIFNRIYNKMKKNGIYMTQFVDDISLSSKSHIGGWVVKFCKAALKRHCLWIKTPKLKRFGYKGAWITGVRINQAGKLLVPFKHDKAVVDMLKEKPVSNMNEAELQKLLSKIGYIQQISPQRFIATKRKARMRYKEINKRKYFYKQMVRILDIYIKRQSYAIF